MKYFWLTLRHKWYVFVIGRKLKVSFFQLLFHDWSKFLPCELWAYNRQFFKPHKDPVEFAEAWLHHQNSNKHHWEYWITRSGHNRGDYTGNVLPMPQKYIREMVADWCAACRAYEGHWPDLNNWSWLAQNRDRIQLHPVANLYLDQVLNSLRTIL